MDSKRDLITKAFIAMSNEMNVEDIRIQDLVDRAGVSKATFYRLFTDKYDVMSSAFTEVASSVVSSYPDLHDWKMWSYLTLDHIQKNKAFYRNILSFKGQNSFADTIRQMFYKNVLWGVRKQYGRPLPEDIQFAIEAMSHVNAFAVVKWIEGDCQLPMETLVGYVDKCIPECLRAFY